MTGQNTILFLFNKTDLIPSGRKGPLNFIFGPLSEVIPPEPEIPCIYPIEIDRTSNQFNFECGCDYIDYDSNSIIIDCETSNCIDLTWKPTENGSVEFSLNCIPFSPSEDGEASFDLFCNDCNNPSNDVVFTNIRSYFGHTSYTTFLIDFANATSYFGFSSEVVALNVANMRIYAESYFGYSSSSELSRTYQFEASSHFGYESKSSILFDPYNQLIPTDQWASSYFGLYNSNNIVFDPYHEFFTPGNYADFRYGHELRTNNFVFDPYHEFFAEGNYGESHFGYELKTAQFVFDPYNEFFTIGASGSFYLGFYNDTKIQFNPYNKFDTDAISYFGYHSSGVIRYSDNQYISDLPINFDFGFNSSTVVKYADVRASITGLMYNGFSSDGSIQISPGFIGSSYFGYSGRLRYITIGRPYATFNNCIATFGYELHDNSSRPRYFDLSKNECCSPNPNQYSTIEMTDNDDWDVLYGLSIGWGFGVISELCTQPRFSSVAYTGFESKVVDNSVYLGIFECGFGVSAHTRSLQFDSSIEMGYGNFIIDQNEIKIELTKPLDETDTNYGFYFGHRVYTNLGASYSLGATSHHFGYYSSATINVEEALRGNFYFGYEMRGVLNRQATLWPTGLIFGFNSKTTFYEEPYIMSFGFSSECSGLVVENWVEFLEEGELNNDYLYQTENGDVDLTRPNGETMEAAPYTRYIKGRCY